MIRSKNHVPFEMYESISCVKTTSPSFFQQRTKSAKSFYNNQRRDEDINQDRKESYLSSCLNKRKNELVKITKQNKKIYERINSQKSHYSSKNLNKSYQSNSNVGCKKLKFKKSSKMKSGKKLLRPSKRPSIDQNVLYNILNNQGLFSLCSVDQEKVRNEEKMTGDPLVDSILKDRKLMNLQSRVERGKENKVKGRRNLFLIG